MAPPTTQPIMEGQQIRVLDLFSGAGGLTAGLHRASDRFRTVRAVEVDKAAAASYRANHGDTVYVGKIETWLQEDEVPTVDLLVGGPPCQGFSTLGKQNAEDGRNTLWQKYAETMVRAEPKYFIVENVASFLSSIQFRQFVTATARDGSLSDYTFEAKVLNAADFGSAQARKRAVLIGHHRDLPFPGWPQPSHTSKHRTVRDVLGGVPSGWRSLDLPERLVVVDGKQFPGPFTTTELHVGRRYSPLSLQRFSRIPPGGNRFNLPEELLCDAWRKHKTGSADVMGRLHWDKPSVTIRTEFHKPEKGRYLHPVANRALTHYEAALLQGFDPDYLWVGSKTAIAKQIGNAVPIPLGTALGKLLVRQLQH